MNIRRLNANERFKKALNLMFFILLLALLAIPSDIGGGDSKKTLRTLIKKPTVETPLSSYTCDEIYNKAITDEDIYSNQKRKVKFTDKQIIIYYMENCIK